MKFKNTITVPLQDKLQTQNEIDNARTLEQQAIDQWMNRRGNKVGWHGPNETGEIVEKYKKRSWGRKK
jgi:hypothetical protein